jgi:hypothetical protein
MGGDTDDFVRPQHRTCFLSCAVILPQMDTICVKSKSQLQIVINNEECSLTAAELFQASAFLKTVFQRLVFGAVLQNRDPTAQGQTHPLQQVILLIGDQIDPGNGAITHGFGWADDQP